jgi:cytidyltransferase-like protein
MKSKTVLTVGVWDLFHKGHLEYLNLIKKKYPNYKLVVGVLTDKSVKLKKGRNRPIIGEKERLEIVRNIKVVDEAFLCKYFDSKEESINYELNRLKPDVVEWGGEKYSNRSTTQIIGKIRGK